MSMAKQRTGTQNSTSQNVTHRTTPAAGTNGQKTASALLKEDHRNVEALFEQYKNAADDAKAGLRRKICQELVIHARIEEEIFYPACRKAFDDEILNEANVEHDSAKVLIAELMAGDTEKEEDEYVDAKVHVLSEQIKSHVAEEEKPSDGIFAKAQVAGIDNAELGQRLRERKQALTTGAQAGGMDPSPLVSFHHLSRISQTLEQENDMAMPPRDERGRFTDDDRGYRGRGRSYSDDDRYYSRSRSRDDDDDDDRRSGGRGEERRSSSYRDDDDDRSYGGRGGRYDDDRGRGGWFGDREGHAEAGRHSWDNRRSGGRYEDDDRRYSRGRDDDDDDRRGGGYGERGWYGDPEGHSEAARRGWEERRGEYRGRGSRNDDDDRGRGRGSRNDDDDRGRRGSDHGGWFGDPRGHSMASRRGWESRR
jgi:hemerythrin superfamily protein